MEPIKAVKGNMRPVYKGVDYTGHSFGAWKVLGPITCERATGKNYKTKWLCQCSCGSEPQYVFKEALLKGSSKGCSSCFGSRNSGSSNPNWKGFGEVTGSVFNQVRSGAVSRGLDLQLIAEDLDALWKSQVESAPLVECSWALETPQAWIGLTVALGTSRAMCSGFTRPSTR